MPSRLGDPLPVWVISWDYLVLDGYWKNDVLYTEFCIGPLYSSKPNKKVTLVNQYCWGLDDGASLACDLACSSTHRASCMNQDARILVQYGVWSNSILMKRTLWWVTRGRIRIFQFRLCSKFRVRYHARVPIRLCVKNLKIQTFATCLKFLISVFYNDNCHIWGSLSLINIRRCLYVQGVCG